MKRSTDASPELSDTMLDQLANQPGVKYTVSEENEDLSRVGVDSMSSLAYREIEQHKELREVVRIAAWEMPLLSRFAKPFHIPTEDQVLRWRYTAYMGEPHPAARKVVVEFQPEKLTDLDPGQRMKMLKLAGARYNPSTKTIKMSCESFETQAQNKRYLADTITKLIAEAKDLETDSFADVPLDTRHHKPRIKHKFPKEWAMTAERKAQLEDKWKTERLEDAQKYQEGKIAHGIKALVAATGWDGRGEAPSMTEAAKQPVLKGKAGKKEMGQQRGQR